MKFRSAIFVFLVLPIAGLRAQYTPEEADIEPQIVKLSILSPGVEYEIRTGRYTSLDAFIGLNPAFGYISEEFVYFLNPTVHLQYRYYYSMRRRALKNKRIKYNSANFLAVHLEATGYTLVTNAPENYSPVGGAGLVWGLQRTFKSGWYLAGFIGPGINLDGEGKAGFFIPFGTRLGYVFRKEADKQRHQLRKMERQGS